MCVWCAPPGAGGVGVGGGGGGRPPLLKRYLFKPVMCNGPSMAVVQHRVTFVILALIFGTLGQRQLIT